MEINLIFDTFIVFNRLSYSLLFYSGIMAAVYDVKAEKLKKKLLYSGNVYFETTARLSIKT